MPARRRFPSNSVFFIAVLAILAGVRLGCGAWPAVAPDDNGQAVLVEGGCQLVRVIDGDTLVVQQVPTLQDPGNASAARAPHEFRIRLLGIDTPETVKPHHPVEPWGKQATAFAREFTASGALSIRLDRRRIDRYGRWLAYVYADGKMLNLELVRNGLARVSVYTGDSASIGRQLKAAERTAREEALGIWSNAQPPAAVAN